MNPVISYVSSILLFFMWFFSANLILTRRYSVSRTIAVVIISVIPYTIVSFLQLLAIPRILFGSLAVIIPMMLLFQDKWVQKLFVVFILLSSTVISELLLLVVLPMDEYIQSNDLSLIILAYLLYLFTNGILQAIIVVVSRSIQQKYSGELNSGLFFLFLLFPISQYVAYAGWFTPMKDDLVTQRPYFMMAALILGVVADVLLAFSVRATARSAVLETRNEILEQQVKAEQEHYSALTANYEDVRHMRHDIDNHLYTIKSLLDDGKTEDAAKYAEQLYQSDVFRARSLPGCENTVAASFLLHKQGELTKHGIRLESNISFPKRIGIPDLDIICALGNLLDNAAEACMALSDPVITLTVQWKSPYLQLNVSNPAPVQQQTKKRRIPELERGVGSEILYQLAERYDGHYESVQAEGVSHTTLFLKGLGQEAEEYDKNSHM